MDLFENQRQEAFAAVAPLAVRMRPRTLEEFVGQTHFLGEGQLFRRLLQADRLGSVIFYGPPGTGKTTLANLIAAHTEADFQPLNATAAGVRDVRSALELAAAALESTGRRTILFVDELHRFNKGQQDVLLGDVERGVVVLIGATTENPFFTINAPLVSRSHLFQFEPLSESEITALLARALQDDERGLGRYGAAATEDAMAHIATKCDGDARKALAALEVAVLSQTRTEDRIVIDLPVAEESIQRKALRYDAGGDAHYDVASALIKSMRGSDPDAAVYWLARMLKSGEDPRFVARRVAICAAEDIGNADPMGLVLANAAFQVTLQVGMPECQLPLAQAVTYLACAPKSNRAAKAVWEAGKDVTEDRTTLVPRHLRSAAYDGATRLGDGQGYVYPHDTDSGFVEQEYLGVDKTYYEPSARGHEAVMREALERLRQTSESASREPAREARRDAHDKEGTP
jgi:putative ATPase